MKGLKWYHWLMIIVLPIGALYCLGRALFAHDLATFLGVLAALAIGLFLGAWLMNPEWFQPFFNFFKSIGSIFN